MVQLTLSGLPFATRITSNENVLEHTHDFYEFLIISEGSLTNLINNEETVMEQGDMMIIPPDVPHSFLLDQKCIHRDVMVSKPLFLETCAFLDVDGTFLLGKKICVSHEALKVIEQLLSTYVANDDLLIRAKEERAIVAHLISLSLFPAVSDAQTTADFKTQCVSIVGEKFVAPNAIQIICDYFHYNQSYMCEKFKRVFGVTMTDYINELRIARAAYLLSVSSYSLREICDSIGFNSLSYFNKLFKEKYVVSPAKYRKQYVSSAKAVSVAKT